MRGVGALHTRAVALDVRDDGLVREAELRRARGRAVRRVDRVDEVVRLVDDDDYICCPFDCFDAVKNDFNGKEIDEEFIKNALELTFNPFIVNFAVLTISPAKKVSIRLLIRIYIICFLWFTLVGFFLISCLFR